MATQGRSNAAAEAAAREAQKEARRKILRAEIAQLKSEIGTLEGLEESYSTVHSNISASITDWNRYKSQIDSDNLYTVVQLKDYFEGNTAGNQSPLLIQALADMVSTASSVTSYNALVQSQIDRIASKIYELQSNCSAKQAELNSI